MSESRVVIEVPATSANLGPGFDTYGLALNIYNRYTAEILFEDSPEYGQMQNPAYPIYWDLPEELKGFIPTDNKNVFLQSLLQILNEKDVELPPLKISMEINIPLSRGLGSSANAIVGGLFLGREILRKFYDHKVSLEEIQFLANHIEGHPDNITPAIFGNFCFCFGHELGDYVVQPFKHKPAMLLLIPHYSLSTHEARTILPTNYRVETVVDNMRAAVMWQRYLETGQEAYLMRAVEDKVHQPYRGKLIQEWEKVNELSRDFNALGCVISGAGPSMMIFLPQDGNLTGLKHAIADYIQSSGRKLDIVEPSVDSVGTRLIESW